MCDTPGADGCITDKNLNGEVDEGEGDLSRADKVGIYDDIA
jgi:hypothetical protein